MNTKPTDSIHPSSSPITGALYDKGLTKREYFAALALQGILSKPTQFSQEEKAQFAVEYADELIKALNEASND